jgi:hypothetical protein
MHLSQGNTTLSFGIIVIALITALVSQFTWKFVAIIVIMTLLVVDNPPSESGTASLL